jgi:acyl transferase domain-containing protein
VYFADALALVLDEVAAPVLVEVGPHPVLAPSIREVLAARGQTAPIVSSLRRRQPERATMLEAVGALHSAGVPVAWDAIVPAGRVARLPYTPWQRESFWSESPELEAQRKGGHTVARVAAPSGPAHPLLGHALGVARPLWDQRIDAAALPYLVDHRVQKDVVFPGAGYLEMAMAATGVDLGAEQCVIEDVELSRALVLGDTPVLAQTVISDRVFDVYSRPDGGTEWSRHITGKVRREPATDTAIVDRDAIAARCAGEMAADY